MNTTQKLKKLGACSEAIKWFKQGNFKTIKEAWESCERGDWMLWILGKMSGSPVSKKRRKLVLCACECARLVLKYTRDKRVRVCIETAEKWARHEGDVGIHDVRAAAYAANAAAYAANAAAYAANAAAYAANAAHRAAAHAAHAAAYAAAHAAHRAAAKAADAADAAHGAVKRKTLKKCADIVRKHYPKAPRLGVK